MVRSWSQQRIYTKYLDIFENYQIKQRFLRIIIIYITMSTMALFVIFGMLLVWPIINIINIFIICCCTWSICCCMASSWQCSSLSFFISSQRIAKSCCICIPIMLIILSREDSTSHFLFLHIFKNCLEKANNFGGSLMGDLVEEELMDPDPATIAVSLDLLLFVLNSLSEGLMTLPLWKYPKTHVR